MQHANSRDPAIWRVPAVECVESDVVFIRVDADLDNAKGQRSTNEDVTVGILVCIGSMEGCVVTYPPPNANPGMGPEEPISGFTYWE